MIHVVSEKGENMFPLIPGILLMLKCDGKPGGKGKKLRFILDK